MSFLNSENIWFDTSRRFKKGSNIAVFLEGGKNERMILGQDTVLIIGNEVSFKGRTLRIVRAGPFFAFEEVSA